MLAEAGRAEVLGVWAVVDDVSVCGVADAGCTNGYA